MSIFTRQPRIVQGFPNRTVSSDPSLATPVWSRYYWLQYFYCNIFIAILLIAISLIAILLIAIFLIAIFLLRYYWLPYYWLRYYWLQYFLLQYFLLQCFWLQYYCDKKSWNFWTLLLIVCWKSSAPKVPVEPNITVFANLVVFFISIVIVALAVKWFLTFAHLGIRILEFTEDSDSLTPWPGDNRELRIGTTGQAASLL